MLPRESIAQRNGSSKNWLAVLDEFDVQFLVLDTRRDRDLYQIIQSQSGWTIDLKAGTKVLFARTRALQSARSAT